MHKRVEELEIESERSLILLDKVDKPQPNQYDAITQWNRIENLKDDVYNAN